MEKNTLYILLLTVAIVIIIIIIFYSNTKNVIRRKLNKTKTTPISSCKENQYVKIIGKAEKLNKTLIAPISKTPCLYYQIIIETINNSNNALGVFWETVFKDEQSVDFIIETKEGKAIVEISRSQNHKKVYLTKDKQMRSGIFNDAPKYIENYLASHGESSEGLFGFNKSMRYSEGIIEIGEPVAILGIANYRESNYKLDYYPTKDLFLSGSPDQKLMITDDKKTISGS